MRVITFVLALFTSFYCCAQFTDDFSDNDFNNNPVWDGDITEYTIDEAGRLRLNDLVPSSNNESYLSLPSIAIDDATWEFTVGFDGLQSGGLSSSNRMLIYLAGDRANLEDDPNGYYVIIGNSEDEISLFSTLSGKIIDGPDKTIEASDTTLIVKVTRDDQGNWELLAQPENETAFISLGVTNNLDFITSAFFGFICDYTTTRATNFFFDDFKVTGTGFVDDEPPFISSLNVIADDSLVVTFSESVEEVTSETVSNYSVNNGVGVPVSASLLEDDFSVALKFASSFTDQLENTLTVNGVEDLFGNFINNGTIAFTYFAPFIPKFRDIVINEIMPDPPSSTNGHVPTVEYIELFNRSDDAINIEGWVLSGVTSSGQSFPEFILESQAFVVLTNDGNTNEFGELDVISWGGTSSSALTNGGETIVLKDQNGAIVDSLSYSESTDGISIEQINPTLSFFLSSNYANSIDPDGGTPGQQNSIFDDTPDTTPPSITSISVVSANEIDVLFDEALDENSAELNENYAIDGDIETLSATLDKDNQSFVHLTISTLPSGVTKTLTVNNVEDLFGNPANDASANFRYIETEDPEELEVVINEYLPDPTPVIGLPDAEYVELYNRSEKFFNLENWTLDGSNMPLFILAPYSYAIIIDDNNISDFSDFNGVIAIPALGLNNSSPDTILLKDNNGNVVHSIAYQGSAGGISVELINPNGPDYSERNYGLSTHLSGGTPGQENSIFDDTPDTTPPAIISLDAINSTELEIEFDEPLEISSAQLISNYSIEGDVSVLSASLINPVTVSLSVSQLPSAQVSVLSIRNVEDLSGNRVNELILEFEYIATEPAETGDILINEFLASPIEESDLPNAEFIELYNRSNKFISLENWVLSDRSNDSRVFDPFIIRPDSFLILTADGNKSLFEPFGNVLQISGFPSLNNSGDDIIIQDSLGQIISFVSYNSSLEGISSELINPNDPCLSFNSFSSSVNPIGGTPGQLNSVFDNTPDTTPPFVASFGFENSLIINFSEVMDDLTLMDKLNYNSMDLSIDQIIVKGSFPTSVEVTFFEKIILGEQYELIINGLADCSGNILVDTTLIFGFGRSPTFNELIITEILFDEEPAVGLPEREYLEIYNATEDVITTAGLQLTDATNTINFPTVNLNPNEYYVLSSSSGAIEFETNAIGISGFPSLNNSGEHLVISLNKELIASLAYDPDWHEEEKSKGGYSLELADITNPCLENSNNWRSSNDPSGGTPGKPNSVSDIIPDNFGPEIINVTAISADSVRIEFNEKIHLSSALTGTIEFQPIVDIFGLVFDIQAPNELIVLLKQNLASNLPINLSISSVFDCSGNEVSSGEFVFALPLPSTSDEIKLSEVLFNPRSNGVDFVEIFNDSENYLSLKNWKLARITDEGVSDQKSIALEEFVIEPQEYIVFTSNTDLLLSNYPKSQVSQFIELPSLPTYSNDTGNVVLLNAMGTVIEHFFYDEDYHYDLLESVDGVSLERISFDSPANEPNNWRSAASTEGFATPGYFNSQAFPITSALREIEITPKVFIPGNSGTGRDFTTINYQMENPGQFANVNIYDQNGRLVRHLVQGELLATSGFLRWDGETNDGSMARLGYYVILFEVYDASGNTETIKETVAIGRDF